MLVLVTEIMVTCVLSSLTADGHTNGVYCVTKHQDPYKLSVTGMSKKRLDHREPPKTDAGTKGYGATQNG